MGGVFTKLIEANTTIPTKKSQIFSTAIDNQPSVEIHVLQGERAMAKDNKSIGRFHLDGIPPSMRGIPQIEVTFDIDSNGIINVSAQDKGTNKKQTIRIESSSGLSQEEIDRMKREAEENAEADKVLKEKAEKINEADSTIFNIEKALKDLDEKMNEEEKETIKSELELLKEAKNSGDVQLIDKSLDSINIKMQEVTQKIYGNVGEQSNDPNNFTGSDVEFEEVKSN
jgi:molecular chaperone DnaK